MKQLLKRLHACQDSIDWVGDRTPEQAWLECECADWMLWLLEREPRLATKRTIVLIACDIAETSLKYVTPGEDRPRLAIEAARAYLDEKITRDQLAAAGSTAWSAAWAAWAAGSAGSAAWAAGSAGSAGSAAGSAGSAGSAAWAAAWAAANKQQSDIIRRHIPAWPGEGGGK